MVSLAEISRKSPKRGYSCPEATEKNLNTCPIEPIFRARS